MNTFRQAIMDSIYEQQIKLGYAKETLRLYFPESSLGYLLGLEDAERINKEVIESELTKTLLTMEPDFGEMHFQVKKGRYAIILPPKAGEYVKDNGPKNEFLEALIQLFQSHTVDFEQVKALFAKYDKDYVCSPEDGIEFDYLLHFVNYKEDTYYYCVKFDVGHGSYHRFNAHDIKDIVDAFDTHS